MIFDTHAHYDDEDFDGDREALFDDMRSKGVEYIVNIGASISSTKATLMLADRYPFIYGAAGVHPSETKELTLKDLEWLKKAAGHKKVVAIGEIGLDYYWPEPDRETQKKWFVRQLKLAEETGLPVVIHSRDAAKDTLDILKDWDAHKTKGVIHCFSYSKEMAAEYVKMGYYIGVGGVVTFKNGRKLKEVVAETPLTSIVLETDCPYLAPVPFRGKRNNSGYIRYVAEEVAKIKGVSVQEVIRQTEENAKKMYGLA